MNRKILPTIYCIAMSGLVLLTNYSWYKEAKKTNKEWSDLLEKTNKEWSNLCNKINDEWFEICRRNLEVREDG